MNTHEETRFLVGPAEEGAPIYRAPGPIVAELLRLEERFAARAGGAVLFGHRGEGALTAFAVRLFRKGYVSVADHEPGTRVLEITALHHEIEHRIEKVFDAAEGEPSPDELVVVEADLPFEGPLAAVPTGMRGTHARTFGVRPHEDPVEVLDNLLYGHTAKDDPESSHYAEHVISDGVD